MNATRLLVALSLAGWNLLAQSSLAVPPGMESRLRHDETNSPWSFHGFAKDPFSDDVYLSIENQVVKVDGNGKRTVLHTLPKNHSTGLIAIPPGSLELFYTDYNTGEFFRWHLLAKKQTSFTGVWNSFDVALTQKAELLVVANPKWPATGANSGIWLMDTTNNNHREVIQLTGPSGPLVFDTSGNLLYAVQPDHFPAPKGSVRLIRFAHDLVRKAILGAQPLTIGQATVVMTGLDGALDLAFDDRQRLYISDPQNGGLLRTLPSSMTLDTAFLKPTKLTTLGLQFVPGLGATFDGFQPGDGGDLYLATTDWINTTGVWQIRAARPTLSSKPELRIPRGAVELSLEKAPANGTAWLVLSASPTLASEIPLFYDLGVPGWVGLDLSRPHVVVPATTDAAGVYRLRLNNPGGATLRIHLQALAAAGTTQATRQVGTSNILSLLIDP